MQRPFIKFLSVFLSGIGLTGCDIQPVEDRETIWLKEAKTGFYTYLGREPNNTQDRIRTEVIGFADNSVTKITAELGGLGRVIILDPDKVNSPPPGIIEIKELGRRNLLLVIDTKAAITDKQILNADDPMRTSEVIVVRTAPIKAVNDARVALIGLNQQSAAAKLTYPPHHQDPFVVHPMTRREAGALDGMWASLNHPTSEVGRFTPLPIVDANDAPGKLGEILQALKYRKSDQAVAAPE